jgi:3-methyladenine DNA glycosylase AlkD
MKVFVPNEELDSKIKKLIRSFRKQMDGDISDQMNKRGVKYRLNFGISLVNLREKAKTLPRDVEFADRLWHRGIRETMILATMAAPPDVMPEDTAFEWVDMIDNCELVEQAALNLFSKTEFAPGLIKHLFGGDAYKRALAYYTAGWILRNGKADDDLKGVVFDAALKEDGEEDVFCLYRGVTHVMRQMLRTDSGAVERCNRLIEDYRKKENKNLNWVVSELKDELEYM